MVGNYSTIDGVTITDGLRVWDYDLEPVQIDLNYREPFEETNQNDGSKELWFYVMPLDKVQPHHKLMSAKRVRVNHPTTGKKA
jgi:hypothetical protein